MNPRYLLSGLIGAIVGALGTYFVMEHIHDKEINDIYADLAEPDSDAYDELVDVYAGEEEVSLGGNLRLVLGAEQEDADDLDVALAEHFVIDDEDEGVEEGEGEEVGEDEDEPNIDTFGGVYIIAPEMVSGSQVVMTYDRSDGSAEVNKMMSVPSAQFDDVIESDALRTLINEEAFMILKRSRARSKDKDPRLVCVRNNVLNLDFVISY